MNDAAAPTDRAPTDRAQTERASGVDGKDAPRVWLHPPSVFFGGLILGYVARLIWGGGLDLPRAAAEGVGGLLMIAALLLFTSALRTFGEAGEALKPPTPSYELLTGGPYRFTRNPIYLAMTVYGVGFAVTTSNAWILLTTAIAALLIHFFVILPEEAYLGRRFGEAYAAYRARVRRWI